MTAVAIDGSVTGERFANNSAGEDVDNLIKSNNTYKSLVENSDIKMGDVRF